MEDIQEIIQGCLNKNNIAQKWLYEKYAPKMLGVCIRYIPERSLAEDVLHDAFIKVFMNIQHYKQQAPIEAWIRRIVVNTSLNYIRDHIKKRRADIDIDTSFEELHELSTSESQLSVEILLSALHALPDGYRTVFNLYEIEGYSHKEIGVLLSISENTSRSQLVKAKRFLTHKLLNKDDFI